MQDSRHREILIENRAETLPRQAMPLAATPKRRQPGTRYFPPKRLERGEVTRHGKVVKAALHHRPQPVPVSAIRSCQQRRSSCPVYPGALCVHPWPLFSFFLTQISLSLFMPPRNSREYILRLNPRQLDVYHSPARFRVLVAGRRFGKTHLALSEMLHFAQVHGRVIWYVGPSCRQAKHIAWNRLKSLTRPYWAKTLSETDLSIPTHLRLNPRHPWRRPSRLTPR